MKTKECGRRSKKIKDTAKILISNQNEIRLLRNILLYFLNGHTPQGIGSL